MRDLVSVVLFTALVPVVAAGFVGRLLAAGVCLGIDLANDVIGWMTRRHQV